MLDRREESQRSSAALERDHSGPAVMIVEDDDAIREALEDILCEAGYRVLSASDGQRALALLGGELRPDAILVDLRMPVMDGWALLDTVQADPVWSRIPRVVFTAARDPRVRRSTTAQVLTKPVRLNQVLELLERLTAGRAPTHDEC